MTRTTALSVSVLALAVIVLASVFTGRPEAVAQVYGSGGSATQVVEGNFRVNYACYFADKSSDKQTQEQVKRIEFHNRYVVLIGQNGDGHLIPIHAIKTLHWEPS